MKKSIIKVLLLVVGVLGMIQGIITLIGGTIAISDKSKNIDDKAGFSASDILSGGIASKYSCGLVRFSSDPGKVRDFSLFEFGHVDRGWFHRVYDRCSSDEGCDRDLSELNGLKVVLAHAVVCGLGWVAAGVVALAACAKVSKLLALVAATVLAACYCLSIGLFSAVWDSVHKVETNCIAFNYKRYARQAKKSAREFLGCSICSFVLVLGAMVCSFVAVYGMGKPEEGEESKNCTTLADVKNTTPALPDDNSKHDKDQDQSQLGPLSGDPSQLQRSLSKIDKDPVLMPTGLTPVGKEFSSQFAKLNKYIDNREALNSYADKQFDKTDVDHSGTLVLTEFRNYVTNIMTDKNVPAPSEGKINSLLRKYDKDENGMLDKAEFRQMLLEIFLESRESLLRSYAEKKASSWKTTRPIGKKDLSRVEELDELLKDSGKLYEQLETFLKANSQSLDEPRHVSEVAEVLKRLCSEYKVPVISRDDVVEIMFEVGKTAQEYSRDDLKLAAFATLAVSRNLLK